jgi:hypothetical protein
MMYQAHSSCKDLGFVSLLLRGVVSNPKLYDLLVTPLNETKGRERTNVYTDLTAEREHKKVANY